MNKRKWMALGLALLLALVLIQSAAAMSSTNYRLDWFTASTSGGGGAASSTNYAANFTVGQSAIGISNSTQYRAELGLWYGLVDFFRLYLPLILKDL